MCARAYESGVYAENKSQLSACLIILVAVHLYKDHSHKCTCATTAATIYAFLLLSQKEGDDFLANLSLRLEIKL